MFDCLPTPENTALDAVRQFILDHGHELAEAGRLLVGAGAEARVIACIVRLETAISIDSRMRRDLAAIHRLLALQDVGHPDNIETALFSQIDPASRDVETICLLTDRLETLIEAIRPHRPNSSAKTDRRDLSRPAT